MGSGKSRTPEVLGNVPGVEIRAEERRIAREAETKVPTIQFWLAAVMLFNIHI